MDNSLPRTVNSTSKSESIKTDIRPAAEKNGQLRSVPEGWGTVKIGSLGKVVTGTTPSTKVSEYYSPPEVDFIAPADLGHTRLIYNSDHKISHYGLKTIRSLPKDAVMCVCIGSSIGKVGMTSKDACATNQQINSIICSNRHFPAFIYYLLSYYSQYWRGFANFGPVPILSKGRFEAIDVVVPLDKGEQVRIAAVLGLVQRAIEQQDRLIALTTELKKALLHKVFTEGLRGEPQKQTEIGPVPESWEVSTLENNAIAFDYGTSVKCEPVKGGVPVLRIPNVVSGSIDLSDLKYGQPKRTQLGQLRLQHGDLLFVRTNGVLENAGRCALYRGELENCYFASYLIRVRVDSSKVLPAFVNEYARTERGRSFTSGRAIRTADGKFNINAGTLKRVLLPVPSLDEQTEMVRRLDLVERKIALHKAKRLGLIDLFHTLLHQLMTAQIRVHNLELNTDNAVVNFL